ncbi:MAG: hypothetical protein ACRDP1_02175 [Nocardioidaceae bacterium]
MSHGEPAVRGVVGGLGLAAVGYGLYRAYELGPSAWRPVLTWLAGGVLLHDAVLAPAVVAAGFAAAHWLPHAWRQPLVVALVVWGSTTLFALPVLGRYGQLPSNPNVLDRPYLESWWIGTAVVAAVVVVWGVVTSVRTTRRDSEGPAR